MKKIISSIVGILLFFSVVIFAMPTTKSNQTNAIISENEIFDKRDIISTDKNKMPESLANIAKEGETPFDSSAKATMEGYSITPTTSSSLGHNQVDSRYSIIQFSMLNTESLYMWIYIPDDPYDNYYSLEIGFESQNSESKIYWHFTPYQLYELLNNKFSYSYGWKFLELTYNDATISGNVDENTIFFIFNISYKYISGDNPLDVSNNFSNYITNDSLSIYHMYLARKTSENSCLLLETDYVYYSVKNEFINELDKLCLNDSYKIKNKSDMFNYIYVGKKNLLLKNSNNDKRFVWNISITESKKEQFDIYEGENYQFTVAGETLFKIEIKETRETYSSLNSNEKILTILDFNKTIYIKNYIFGSFSYGFLEVDADESYCLYFKVSKDFVQSGEVIFTSSNEKRLTIESFSYNSSSNTYEVIVKGIKNGRASVIVESSGKRLDKDTIEKYYSYCTLEISGASSKGFIVDTILIYVIAYVVLIAVFSFFTIRNIMKYRRIKKSIK